MEVGVVAIKGLFSGRYLAMNKRGRLYASVSPGARVGRRAQTEQLAPLDVTSEDTQGHGQRNALSGDMQGPAPQVPWLPTRRSSARFCLEAAAS